MRVPLFEGYSGAVPFVVDRSKPFVVTEAKDGKKYTRVPGCLGECDVVNGNGRIYPVAVWEANFKPGSDLMTSIAANEAWGMLEHPKDGTINLATSPISHLVTEARLVEDFDQVTGRKIKRIVGEIAIAETDEGKRLKAFIDMGYNPKVSSRGYGSLVKREDGVDVVQEDYICESWDVVYRPSFKNAILNPTASSTEPVLAPKPAAESVAEPKPAPLKETSMAPQTGPVTVVTPSLTQPSKSNSSMNLNEIKSRINALESRQVKGPQMFAESMQEAESLHQEVAAFGAENPKASYDVHKMHAKLDDLAESWQKAAAAPAANAAKLQESTKKLMRVVEATAKTGLTYKSKLAEALKEIANLKKLNEELARRGRGWMNVAEGRKDKITKMDKRLRTVGEALDIVTARYHEDTTELSRELVIERYKEQTKDPKVMEALKKCDRMRQVGAIREQLDPKSKKPAAPAAPAPAPVAPVNENKPAAPAAPATPAAPAPAPAAPVNENKPASQPTPAVTVMEAKIVSTTAPDPRGLTEAVNMARRLSSAAV